MAVVRIRRVLVGLLPMWLALATPAGARVTVEGPAGDMMIPRLRQWADNDLMPTGDGVIQVVPENCMQMQAAACTYWTNAPHFVMYFPDLAYLWTQSGYSEGERESTWLNFYHELGHVLDFGLPRHGYRLKWFSIMHYEAPSSRRRARELVNTRNPRLWLSALGAEGEVVIPDEQFAQAYNYCARGMNYAAVQATMHGTYWGFSYDPSRGQYAEACQLIRGL